MAFGLLVDGSYSSILAAVKSRRLAFLVAAATLPFVAASAACNTDGFDVTGDGDGGVGTGSVEKASCPKTEPANGTECSMPEGTTCDFGRCGSRIARCSAGTWRFGTNVPPKPPCPEAPPENDAPCPQCWPPNASCTYFAERCSDPDAAAGQNTALASCPLGKWSVTILPCRDAGADVQGDADAGSD
jgi:hypothetical protein